MDRDTTRRLVEDLIDARARNDVAAIAAVLADDAEWHPPTAAGLPVFRGRDEVAAALAGGATGRFLDLDTVQRDVQRMIVDGDAAAVQQRLSARTHDGERYVNDYCWVFTCTGGRIRRLDEYADTLHAARVFGLVTDAGPGTDATVAESSDRVVPE